MDIIDEIKIRVSMKELLAHYGIYPVRGQNIYRCIEHQPDRNPSGGIIKQCDKFHCYRCNKTWDIIDVVQTLENVSKSDAIKLIDKTFKLGICGAITPEKQAEIDMLRAKREKERKQRAERKEFVRQTLNHIAKELRHWEQVQKDSHPTRRQVREGNWISDHSFFTALKMQERLNWLYDKVAGFNPPTSEYDFTIGNERIDILRKLRKGEIKI